MKIAVTITICGQIGIDQWKDFHYTKSFELNTTIEEIDKWIKSIAPKQSIFDAIIGKYEN